MRTPQVLKESQGHLELPTSVHMGILPAPGSSLEEIEQSTDIGSGGKVSGDRS